MEILQWTGYFSETVLTQYTIASRKGQIKDG